MLAVRVYFSPAQHDKVKKKVHLDDMRCAGSHKLPYCLLSAAQQLTMAVSAGAAPA